MNPGGYLPEYPGSESVNTPPPDRDANGYRSGWPPRFDLLILRFRDDQLIEAITRIDVNFDLNGFDIRLFKRITKKQEQVLH